MKKIISMLLTALLLLSCISFVFAGEEVSVVINGETLVADVAPLAVPVYDEASNYVGDRIMVPLRAICEKLNLDVAWDAETAGIILYRKGNIYFMWVGKETAFNIGEDAAIEKGYTMDAPTMIYNNRTLVPLRAVSELLGAKVEWLGETKTADIQFDLGEPEDNAGASEALMYVQKVLLEMYDVYKAYINGEAGTVTGKFILESGREIKFELYENLAPITCRNFIQNVENKFYDNTVFHRVIKDFVAQGGGFDKAGKAKEAMAIPGEFVLNGFLNLIPHNRGALSLARADDPNSGSSQFFIVHKDAPYLNSNYAAFGKITEGMEYVDEICEAEVNEFDEPVKPIVVKTVVLDK